MADPLTTLDELTRVVLAPNPSPMTLEGTNTYLLGRPDHGAVVVIDPGPAHAAHLEAIEQAIADAEVAAVIITHHHLDHAQAAGWAERWGASLRAFDPQLVPGAQPLRDGEIVEAAGVSLEALHTPGHASDHLCLRLRDSDVVLTGDHVLGRGTSIVNWPDGDMAAYMDSLERLSTAPGRRVFPGHGPMVEDPAAKVAEYLAHRREREAQVRDAMADGAETPAQIVAAVYTDTPTFLHPAAERSVRAILAMLAEAGDVAPSILDSEPMPMPPVLEDPSQLGGPGEG